MLSLPPGPLVVDAGTMACDGATIDRLARLELDARRVGRYLLVRNPSADLRSLIAFAGLADVLRVEPRRKPEQRKEPLDVEEERQLLDPPA